jgi:hypothetical protein
MKFSAEYKLVLSDYKNRRIDLSFPESEPARFQIPKLYMPFGLSGFQGDYGGKKWNVDFALKGLEEEGGQTKKFYDFLKDLETKVVTHVWENSQQIFGRSMPYEAVEAMFNSNIKQSAQYEPKFRVKVDVDPDENIKPKIFDSNGAELSGQAQEKLHARQTGVAIVEACSVYFMNKMFGITWKLHQLKVYDVKSAPKFKQESWADSVEACDESFPPLTGFKFQSTS